MKMKEKPALRKISRGRQITLLPDFCEKTGIGVGDYVSVEMEGDRLIITPMHEKRQKLADELVAILSEPVEGEFSDDDKAMAFAIEQIKQYRKDRQTKRSTHVVQKR